MSDSQESDFKRHLPGEWVKRQIVRNFDAALVGGSSHCRYIEKLGMLPERIRIGYDVVDNSHFENGAWEARRKSQELREQYRLPQRYILCAARFVKKKNLDTLVQAYEAYRREIEGAATEQPWDLVILGDGPERARIVDQSKKTEISTWVHFPGFREYAEMPVFYGLAEAFILPSKIEQWGLVVNEAMAAGLPVLVSNRCGSHHDLVERENGAVFEPSSAAAIKELLLLLTRAPPEVLARMGAASRSRIASWSPETFANSAMELVELVASTPGKRMSLRDLVLVSALKRRHVSELRARA